MVWPKSHGGKYTVAREVWGHALPEKKKTLKIASEAIFGYDHLASRILTLFTRPHCEVARDLAYACSYIRMEGACRYAPAASILLGGCFLPMFLGKLDSNSVDDHMEIDIVAVSQIPRLCVAAGQKCVQSNRQRATSCKFNCAVRKPGSRIWRRGKRVLQPSQDRVVAGFSPWKGSFETQLWSKKVRNL